MTHSRCPDCGAGYPNGDDSCQRRFDALLALDHSHREPWGSRHGLAFAVYALQHPSDHTGSTRAFALELLTRVLLQGEPLPVVVADFRARQLTPRSQVAPESVPPTGVPYPVTIADLGNFAAATYPEELERWCRATLAALG